MNLQKPFDQVCEILPHNLRQVLLNLPKTERILAEEIRMRVGQPVSITLPEREVFLPDSPIVASKDLHSVLEFATKSSAHTALERVCQGYVAVAGGHRLGLCGSVVNRDGKTHNLRSVSSLNLRIAKQIPGIGEELLRKICKDAMTPSVLVLAPPGVGKTTLLRDLIRGLSYGVAGKPQRVGVADERGELAAMWNGAPQFDLGPHTDVLDGCSKAEGLMILLRGMNPQVLAMDEITAPEDVEALQIVAGCGVSLLATAHGQSMDDLRMRPLYEYLLQRKIFRQLIWIKVHAGVREYRMEEIMC